MEVVVLFAGDSRMMQFSLDVCEQLKKLGMDVMLHCSFINNNGLSGYIKPDNLISVIAESRTDFLLVLGDKNMRNRSCQIRRGGKLVELSVHESAEIILKEWADMNGVEYFEPGLSCSGKDISRAVEQIDNHRIGNMKHRLQILNRSCEEFANWKLRWDNKEFLDVDAAAISSFTKCQQYAIWLHKHFRDILKKAHALRGCDEWLKFDETKYSIDLGLGHGVDTLPNFADLSCPPNVSHMPAIVPFALKKSIIDFVEKKLAEIFQACEHFRVSGKTLWTVYYDSLGSSPLPSTPSTMEEQQLVDMGFDLNAVRNLLGLLNHDIESSINVLLTSDYDTSANIEFDEDQIENQQEWSVTGGSKSRKRDPKKKPELLEFSHRLKQQNAPHSVSSRDQPVVVVPTTTTTPWSPPEEVVKKLPGVSSPPGLPCPLDTATPFGPFVSSPLWENDPFFSAPPSPYNNFSAASFTLPAVNQWEDDLLPDNVGTMDLSLLRMLGEEDPPMLDRFRALSFSESSEVN